MTDLPLDALSDFLRSRDVSWTFRRNDELSGSGDGRVWSAELARPLWQVSISLSDYYAAYGRRIDATLRMLGVNRPFLFRDPSYVLPIDPGAGATVTAIGPDRDRIALSSLAGSYAVSVGDRLSIKWGDRYYLGEFCEDRAASPSGALALTTINPPLPFGVITGAAVELRAPILRAIVPPGGHQPYGTTLGGIATGASLTLLQKV